MGAPIPPLIKKEGVIMIRVTRMNGVEFVMNAELIEFIDSTPDTVITLTNGRKFILKDSLDEVLDKVIAYRRAIGTKIIYQNRPDAVMDPDDRCDK